MRKSAVPVVLDEKEGVRFVEKDGREELHIGMGRRKEITRRKLVPVARKVIREAKQHKAKCIVVSFSDFSFPQITIGREELASLIAQNFEMANFEFRMFKTKPKKGWDDVEEVVIVGGHEREVRDGFKRGVVIGEEVNKCRALSNTPGGDMTPALLAAAAKKAARGTKVRVSILGKKEMQELKMGAILGVAKGSSEEPKFIVMDYRGGAPKDAPIVLIGKGVTFDTGGLNLKPESGIFGMHLDMSGGAAAIHSVTLAARLKVKKNVIGLVPSVENMLSGSSYRPGDVLRSMSGKTIDVLNTDAEGRVILADALIYAKRYKPRLVVDIATLTGASLVALGTHASAIMTRDEKIAKRFEELGEESGEYVWPFPLWDEYEEYVKGVFGDVANIPASGNSRHAGVINAGMFLYQFVKDENGTPAYPWVHVDMAPRMETVPSDNLAKGAAGSPVRLLLKLLETY